VSASKSGEDAHDERLTLRDAECNIFAEVTCSVFRVAVYLMNIRCATNDVRRVIMS